MTKQRPSGRRAFLSWMAQLGVASAACAQQVPASDGRLVSARPRVPSPHGHGDIAGYFVRPRPRAGASGPETLPAVLVLAEGRELTPPVEDVARRVALESFMVLAPDLMGRGDPARLTEDIHAAALWLKQHADSTGRLGVIGVGASGMLARALAARMGRELHAVVFFDDAAPASTDGTWERGMLSLIKSLT